MSPTLIAALLFLLGCAFLLLARHYERIARKQNAEWDAIPTLYAVDELKAWCAEHRELEEAGLLEPEQPTPWTHAVYQAFEHGSFKDRVQVRMAVAALEAEAGQ